MNWAKAPRLSDPCVMTRVLPSGCRWFCIVRVMTRSPIRRGFTLAPTVTICPQQSAPWICGNDSASPFHVPSSPAFSLASSLVASVTDFAYQPVRVLMSVLFTPAAATRISTSSGPSEGTSRSSRHSSTSSPPYPISAMPDMVAGMDMVRTFYWLWIKRAM